MVSADSRAILPEPPDELKQLSAELCARITDAIRSDGPLPFSRYMEMALYEPGLGYYSAGLRKFGAGGDFVTAPELGSVFARCLARQAREIAAGIGVWEVLEIGAGSGALAAAFLAAMEPQHAPSRYRILERSASLKQVQQNLLRERVPHWLEQVEWVDQPPTEEWQGLLLANEVPDALPVDRFRLSGGRVECLGVDATENGFAWSPQAAPAALDTAVRAALGAGLDGLPGGYQSEICTTLPAWLEAVTASLKRGVALLVDYGYPRREYYSPERSDGTLVCHYRHRAHYDPFTWPGLQDITAFVDFTALAEAASQCGLEVRGYTSQAMFLIACGLQEVLAGMESLPDRQRLELSREVRILTLPVEMGEKFQAMALARDFDLPLRGFSGPDLRYRL